MRFPALAALLAGLAFALPAAAQAPATPGSGPLGAPGAAAPSQAAPAPVVNAPAATATTRRHMTFQQRFDAANTTHDGKLTLEQAREKMPAVARDFAAIDSTHKGYVTADEIRSYRKAERARKKAGGSK